MESQSTLFDASGNRDEVFREIQKHLSESRFQVLTALWQLESGTDNEIAEKLGWEINRVTGRRNELLELKLIDNIGQEPGPYRYPRTIWKVNELQVNYFLTQYKKEN
jgi:transcription initiation factor IIE alpha subunit